MATAAWVSAGELEKRKFDVPADLADKSLRVFSVQSGTEVLFSSDAASGVRTNAIKGEFLPGEAVKKMLAGTTLYVRDERDGVFRIAATPRPKAPGAALIPGSNDRPGEAKSGARSRDPPPGTSSTALPAMGTWPSSRRRTAFQSNCCRRAMRCQWPSRGRRCRTRGPGNRSARVLFTHIIAGLGTAMMTCEHHHTPFTS